MCGQSFAYPTLFDAPGQGGLLLPPDPPKLLVYHRSQPHGSQWVNLYNHVAVLRERGYKVTILVLIRSPEVNEASQLANNAHKTVESIRAEHARAYKEIFNTIIKTDCPYELIPYESLGHLGYVAWLFRRLELPVPVKTEWVDGNDKYKQ